MLHKSDLSKMQIINEKWITAVKYIQEQKILTRSIAKHLRVYWTAKENHIKAVELSESLYK